MELRQLQTFKTIAKLQSFSKAALELGYAQSSVTSQIQLLEQELKVKLFERLGHTISLTLEGKKLLPIAEQMLQLSNDARNIAGDPDRPAGYLTIGAVESLCATRLPKLLKEYQIRYPDVEILIKFGTRNEFLHALKNNEMDLAFFLEPEIILHDFITVSRTVEPMGLFCAPEHALACKEHVYPQDLSGEPFILTESTCGYRELFNTIISQYHIKPRSLIETGNVPVIKQLIMGNMGITFLPKMAVEEELQKKKFASLHWEGPEFLIYTQVLYHKDKWMSSALTAFIDLMLEMKVLS